MKFFVAFLAALSIVVYRASPMMEHQLTAIPEQTVFWEGEAIRRPVPLPPAILKLLLATPEAKGALVYIDSQKKTPSGLFEASEVQLAGPDESDLLVMGVPPMSGADNTWFWFVRTTGKTPAVLLFYGGNGIELMNSETNGHRDVRGVWSSASETETTIYHFNGREYKAWKKTGAPKQRF